MPAVTLSQARDLLGVITMGLDASPIPEPFKSAVSAIPKIALEIVNMAEVRSTSYRLRKEKC